MKREAAEKITHAMRRIDEIFRELDAVTELIEDEDERKRMRRAFATLVLDIHEKVTLEIVKQFPDLHPDKDRL